MKHYIIVLITFCFSAIVFSQEKSLFSSHDQTLLDNLTIKKNDYSLLYKQLLNDNSLSENSFLLPDYRLIQMNNSFLESENSATKHVMPIYKPEGNFKQKSIFLDNTMNHFIITEPVKER